MATNSMDFTSGLPRPSGSKAMAENYLGSTAHPYALRAINAAMGSKHMNPDESYEDATGSYSKSADGKNFPCGSSVYDKTTQTQNTGKETPAQDMKSFLSQAIANTRKANA